MAAIDHDLIAGAPEKHIPGAPWKYRGGPPGGSTVSSCLTPIAILACAPLFVFPLLALSGLCLLGSAVLLVVSSPLLLLFSPLVVPAGFILATVLAALGSAAAMFLAGIASFAWLTRMVGGERTVSPIRVGGGEKVGFESLTESGYHVTHRQEVDSLGRPKQQMVQVLLPRAKGAPDT